MESFKSLVHESISDRPKVPETGLAQGWGSARHPAYKGENPPPKASRGGSGMTTLKQNPSYNVIQKYQRPHHYLSSATLRMFHQTAPVGDRISTYIRCSVEKIDCPNTSRFEYANMCTVNPRVPQRS